MPRPELEELDGFARTAIRRRLQELRPKAPEAVEAAPESEEMSEDDKTALEQFYTSQG